MITREDVEARLADLRRQFAGVQAALRVQEGKLQAIDGAIQDCEHWLEVVAQREAKGAQLTCVPEPKAAVASPNGS
jgi:hypothetical protein